MLFERNAADEIETDHSASRKESYIVCEQFNIDRMFDRQHKHETILPPQTAHKKPSESNFSRKTLPVDIGYVRIRNSDIT